MQVFKLFFHIIYRYKLSVFVSLFIAFGFSIMFVKSGGSDFKVQKADIAIIDNDQSTASKALSNFLDESTNVKAIHEDKIEEAIFYKDIEYVLYIPKGFEVSIQQGEKIKLEKKQVEQSMSAFVVDNFVQAYVNTLHNYLTYGNKTLDNAIQATNVDMAIKIESESVHSNKPTGIHYYFNFLAYSFFIVLISAIATVMIALNRSDIKRRNTVSPVSNVKMNISIGFASTIFGIFIFTISTVFAYLMFSKGMQSLGAYLYLINLAVLLIPATGLAYLISSAIKNPEAINGISNIVCLGLAFLGGSFVPQEMLSESVLNVARFTPTYWFVNSNDRIMALTSLDAKYVQPIYFNMLILLGFGVIFFSVALWFTNQQRKNIVS